MSEDGVEQGYVRLKIEDLLHASQSLIAASSILVAASDQYANTGTLSVGAVLHAGHVIDNVIERLDLAELAIEHGELPF